MKILTAACLAVPAIVSAAPAGHHAAFHDMLVRKLGLSQGQQDAIHTVMKAHKASLHAKHEAAFKAKADLLQALVDPQTTPDRVQALQAAASSAHLAVALEINQIVKEIAPVLTPDQITKAQQLAAEARGHVESLRAWFMSDSVPADKP